MKQKSFIITILCLLLTSVLFAQTTGEITGIVVDEKGNYLPGANVIVVGTSTGVATDNDGTYSLDLSPGTYTVRAEYLGYESVAHENVEVSTGATTEINFALSTSTLSGQDVVVVGYGSKRRENLTGSVASVDFTELEAQPSANTANLLQGKMTGVQVSSFSSQPGEDDPQIRIRGIGTLNAGQEPLIIVDGVELSLSQISPEDIESVSVLKDAASASIYGVRAANGVILVKTKEGKSEKPKLTFRQSTSWQDAIVRPNLVDSWDYAKIQNLDKTEKGEAALYSDEQIQIMRDGSDLDRWSNTNWFDEMYRVAPMQTTYLSVSGVKDNINYLISGEYVDQDGIMIQTGAKRFNLHSKIDVAVTDRISIGMNLFGTKKDITETLNNASASNNDQDLNYILRRFSTPLVPVKYSNGYYGQVDGLYYEGGGSMNIKNPVEYANRGENLEERNSLTGMVHGDVQIIDNLHYRPSLSYVYYSSLGTRFTPTFELYDADGIMMSENIHNSQYNSNVTTKKYEYKNLLTYDIALNDIHKISTLLGQEAQLYRLDYFSASVKDFPNNNVHELDGGINEKDVSGNARELALSSYFGRLNYILADKYLFEFNYRYDGTSRMSADNRWGGFPSLSAGWILSNEDFLDNLGPVSSLKARASWGQLGNQNIGGSNFYPYAQTIETGQNYIWGGSVTPGVAVTSLANPDLTWETTTITDFGIDLSLFNDKIQIVADWFDKTSTDILVRLPIPTTLGNVSAPFQNIGKVSNTGWELGIRGRHNVSDFGFSSSVNLSHVENEVVDYGGLESISGNAITKEGLPIGSYYAYEADGYYQTQEELDNAPTQFGGVLRLGDVKYVDISGPDGVPDGKISSDFDRTVIGNPFPDFQYSFDLGAEYKGFNVYAYFQGIQGIDRYYWYNTEIIGTMTDVALDYWTEDNTDAPTPRWGNLTNNNKYSSFWLKDASYLRLKNIEFGYTLPSRLTSKYNMQNVRIYMSGINLWTLSEVEDYDPEKLTNDDRNRDYPHTKVYSVGVSFNFTN